MKLYYTPASPYARKVRVVSREKGLEKRIEEVYAHPLENPPELIKANPLGKIPALVFEDNRVLVDSPLIAEYLDTLGRGPVLFPKYAKHWDVLQRAALADGVMDATVALVIEGRKPEAQRSPMWQERYHNAITRTLQLLAAHPPKENELNIATIGLGVALGYLSFRIPEYDWRGEHLTLAQWYEGVSNRPSMQATIPS